ncbi:hypothetical protein [Pseudohaliea rubra]|uniref:Uncharacterized protein n=1 Tax=Pseudohaliea rubra DSM 19751 TaxID=1265313 RepID=A0A095VVD7_9GAMM|nr:hypothetical protein [Pseudohaliea rubra]KGE05003.1 hypothetical protein HRUBRA_00476 [Pseudohaliea rubra DSM 19751]
MRAVVALGAALCLVAARAAAEAPPGNTIGYVFTDLFWSVYQTDGAEECPQGFNDGPREQFAARFPAPEKLSVEETRLAMEAATWHPSGAPHDFAFHEIESTYAYGLDLDGESGPNDFRHPDGSPGIDNEIYRAVGCIIGFRGPDGVEYIFQSKAIKDEAYNRMMINLTGVDSLENDDSITVTVYRGRDELLTDATGEAIMPGGTQRVDRRWGESLIRHTRGRIEDGVLITEPIDGLVIPWQNLQVPSVQRIRGARFELRLGQDGAEGLLAGYADVDTFYYQLIRNDSTHHLANGQISAISLYKALRRLADAYPDPETGEHTAISTALDVRMTRVHIVDEADDGRDDPGGSAFPVSGR